LLAAYKPDADVCDAGVFGTAVNDPAGCFSLVFMFCIVNASSTDASDT
jgi:hypothetical protein